METPEIKVTRNKTLNNWLKDKVVKDYYRIDGKSDLNLSQIVLEFTDGSIFYVRGIDLVIKGNRNEEV